MRVMVSLAKQKATGDVLKFQFVHDIHGRRWRPNAAKIEIATSFIV